jgi:hypothetical protein
MLKVRLYLSCACAAFASPAWAQDIVAKTDDATETTATDTSAGQPSAEDIIVTGFRASLFNAAQIKRDSDAIVDAVVA